MYILQLQTDTHTKRNVCYVIPDIVNPLLSSKAQYHSADRYMHLHMQIDSKA